MDTPPKVKITFDSIPEYVRGNYQVGVMLQYTQVHLQNYVDLGLDMDPDFQRIHVWTETQQVRFVEHLLRGGNTGKDILFNCPGWDKTSEANFADGKFLDFVLVDGKQRLEALRRFFANEITAFGYYRKDITGIPRCFTGLKFHVNGLQTRAEVLQWYLDFNTGGTIHTEDEITRVRALLAAELAKAK